MSFTDAARSLSPAAALAVDLLDATATLAATAPGTGEPDAILAPYDEPLDALLVPAAALSTTQQATSCGTWAPPSAC